MPLMLCAFGMSRVDYVVWGSIGDTTGKMGIATTIMGFLDVWASLGDALTLAGGVATDKVDFELPLRGWVSQKM